MAELVWIVRLLPLRFEPIEQCGHQQDKTNEDDQQRQDAVAGLSVAQGDQAFGQFAQLFGLFFLVVKNPNLCRRALLSFVIANGAEESPRRRRIVAGRFRLQGFFVDLRFERGDDVDLEAEDLDPAGWLDRVEL